MENHDGFSEPSDFIGALEGFNYSWYQDGSSIVLKVKNLDSLKEGNRAAIVENLTCRKAYLIDNVKFNH